MTEREFAGEKMQEYLARKYQCNWQEILFPYGLDMGTTWVSGQDFEADYRIGSEIEGRVFWSTVGQVAYE